MKIIQLLLALLPFIATAQPKEDYISGSEIYYSRGSSEKTINEKGTAFIYYNADYLVLNIPKIIPGSKVFQIDSVQYDTLLNSVHFYFKNRKKTADLKKQNMYNTANSDISISIYYADLSGQIQVNVSMVDEGSMTGFYGKSTKTKIPTVKKLLPK